MAREPLDVLVIGGGITGVGAALDAASRGLRVGIVERDDWASGTSSRSSKMIHGGLRYLATGDIGVVRESLRERAALQRNAAHLVRPLSMLLPVYGGKRAALQRAKLGIGLWVYEALGHRRAAGQLHDWIGLSALTRIVPGVSLEGEEGGGPLTGAQHYHDASADDARLVIGVLRTAVAHGAMAVNGAAASELLREGDRVTGARITLDDADPETAPVDVRARVVINATGVWADSLLKPGDASFRILPSKGIHLTVSRERVGIDSGIAFFSQTGNSNVFIEPWQEDLAFIGTTDTPYSGDLSNPEATEQDISGLLDLVNAFLRNDIQRSEVIQSWAGLRPLVAPEDGDGSKSKDVSRRHVLVDRPGIVTITGGKLTAYRAMAELAVDAAASQLGERTRSITRNLPLDGCRSAPTSEEVAKLATRLSISRGDARHLHRRHGANVPALLALVDADPTLADRLHPDRPYLRVEATWAVEHEQARDVEDIIARRTRLSLEVTNPELAEESVRRAFDCTPIAR